MKRKSEEENFWNRHVTAIRNPGYRQYILDTGHLIVNCMVRKRQNREADLPGIQFYSGNFLAGAKGKEGAVYGKGCGICFETQYFPDAIHKDNFESPITKAGEVYDTTTTYRFC